MSQTLYISPSNWWSLFATVSGVTSDLDHLLAYLVDGRPGFPLRTTSGTGTITLTKAAGPVNLVAICHHLLDAGLTVTIGGDASGSIVIPAYPPNGVPLNAWDLITAGSPPDVGSLTLAISGNSTDIVIGEAVAGYALALDPSLKIESARFSVRRYLGARSGNELSGIPEYTEGAASRPLSGSQTYDTATLQAILDWFDSQDLPTSPYPVPSLLIPDSSNPNDARLVTLNEPRYSQVGPEGSDVQWLVELDFTEYPRTRW